MRSDRILFLLILTLSMGLAAVTRAAEGPNQLQFTLGVDVEEVEVTPDGEYQHIALRSGSLDELPEHAGQPQLPLRNAFFILPAGKALERVELVPLVRRVLPGEYQPYPILASDDLDGPPPEPPWDGLEVYPDRSIFWVTCGDSRDYNLLKVTYYPLSYDASTERLTLDAEQELTIILRDRTSVEEGQAAHIRRPTMIDGPFGSHRQWIRDVVRNPEDLDRYYPRYEYAVEDGVDQDGHRGRGLALNEERPYGAFVSELPSDQGLGVTFVIVTNDVDENGNDIGAMADAFQPLATALTERGLVTQVRTIAWIEDQEQYMGFDRPNAIRRFLFDSYERWGTMYVLLGGDESVVPTRRIGVPDDVIGYTFQRPDPPADFWYTRFGASQSGGWGESWNEDGDAWIGESWTDIDTTQFSVHGFSSVYLGRLPARNAGEAAAIVEKTLRYRLLPPYEDQAASAAFYTSGMVAGGPTLDRDAEAGNGIHDAEIYFADSLQQNLGWTVCRLYPDIPSVTCPGDDYCFGSMADFMMLHAASEPRWTGTRLRDRMNTGDYHFVFHEEHSLRNRWGKPTTKDAELDRDCGGQYLADCDSVLEVLFRTIQHVDDNEVLSLQNAPPDEEARFFIAMSGGSWTNMMDMNAISESFLRAKSGGAVAYVGKADTFGGPRAATLGLAAKYMFDPQRDYTIAEALAHAIDDKQAGSWGEITYAIGLPLLGDPTLPAWRGPPQGASLAAYPNPITTIGATSLTVTATEAGSTTAIPDALICVRQGTLLYATKRTNGNGYAAFTGLLIQDSADSVIVTLMKPGFLSERLAVPVSVNAPYVAYVSHELDDCGQGADCDEVIEAGETVMATVTLKNLGNATAQSGSAILRATPSFHCNLQINGEYRPADIVIGAKSAHPPTAGEEFDLPLTREGIRCEGSPLGLGYFRETLKVWREDATGNYVISSVSPSRSADSVFTGILKGQAAFSSVSMTGEGNDSYFWSGDSIWFQFHGDWTDDRITFKSEAPEWIDLPSASASIPSLQSGATTEVEYPIEIAPAAPDGENLIFTVFAYQSTTPNKYFHSDFTFRIAKPKIEVWLDDAEFGDFGCQDTSWVLHPLIHNAGTGEADSVRLTLRLSSGSMTVRDSVVTFSEVGPDSFAVNGAFVLCGSSPADTTDLEGSIRTEVYHFWLPMELNDAPFDPCPPAAPENLRADLAEGTVILTWDPVANIDLYRITCRLSANGSNLWQEVLPKGTTRYEIRHHDLVRPSGENGYDYHYYFLVNAGRHQEDEQDVVLFGPRALVGPVFPWVREREGWPKLLSETSVCAPTVLDLGSGEGKAIFAAGARVYAWRADGSPLDTDSLFYDPIGPGSVGQADTRFTEALAAGPWSREPNGESSLFFAGNLRNDGVHLVEIVPNQAGGFEAQLYHEYGFFSNLSPIVAGSVYPYGDRSYADVLWLSGMADGYINGIVVDVYETPYGDQDYHFGEACPAGSSYNYQALALGHNTEDHAREVIAVSRGTDWQRGRVACYSTWGPMQPRWCDSLDTRAIPKGKDQWLSTPAVGDVDGDGDHDVVVTSLWRCLGTNCSSLLAGKVFIIDENDGVALTCNGCESADFHFRRENADYPPAGPALADLDGDGDVEIIIPGNTSDPDSERESPVALRVNVFDYDLGTGNISDASAEQVIPFGQRNEEQGNVNGNSVTKGGAVYPIGSAVVAEVDYDGESCKPDIFVSSSVGAIYAFEYNPVAGTVSAKRGWPLLLPDVAREPVLAVLDPEDPTQWSMVVQCQDGWLHVFDLARPSEAEESCDAGWLSYGGSNDNARFLQGAEWKGKQQIVENTPRTTRITGIGPTPTPRGQEVLLDLARSERVELSIYDAAGRRVATIHSGPLPPGQHRMQWDGTSGGRPVASGVYWYRLTWGSGAESRRVTVLR